MNKNLNIAIFSPQKNAISETFIKAHLDMIYGNIFYYYGNFLPFMLNDQKISYGLTKIIYRLLGRVIYNKKYFDIERALLKSLNYNKIDLILIEYGITAAESFEVLNKFSGPFIVHFHGYDAFRHDIISKYERSYKEIFYKASAVISVSKKMTQSLLELGCQMEKILYNPYGPNDIFFTTSPNYTSQTVVTVGRFTSKKAPMLSIFCFYLIASEFPNSKLIMIGDGPLKEQCKNLAHTLKLNNKVIFTGIKSSSEVNNFLSQAQVYIQHSITSTDGDSEGTPVAILEASAAGLPIISTDHSGIPDVVINGKTGYLVKEGDVKKMAEFLKRILSDPQLAKELGEKGKKNTEEKFLLKFHIEKLNTLIKEVIVDYNNN